MDIVVRPADLPQDYASIASVLVAENPGWALTAEELAYEEASRDPHYYHATFVAEAPEQGLVGVASIGLDKLAFGKRRYELDIRVHPNWQGCGVGKALYQAVIEHIAPHAPREITAMVWQAHPRAARFLLDRGFVETWQRFDSCLDVTNFDWTPYADLEQRVAALGITITTYADMPADADRLIKLYELDYTLWQDVPYGQAVVRRSLKQFAAAEVNHPNYLPEACFIALKDTEFVGYSNLLEGDDGYSIDMTGVLRPYRNNGVATLLKLRGIRYAQEHGKPKLWTVNDSANTAMLALNAKLGFVREGVNVRYLKVLGRDVVLDT